MRISFICSLKSSIVSLKSPGGVACILTCSLLAPLLLAQGLPFTIHGRVTLPDGSPAERVVVRITGQSGLDRQAFTDDMGRYEIPDLPRGRYFLTATNPSIPEQFTDPVEADLGRAFSTRVMVNIYLRTKSVVTSSPKSGSAVISVTEATQRIPKPAQKAFDEAIKLRARRRLDQALEKFNRSIELYPSYFQALAERGHLYIAMGRPNEAAGDFARALELDPHYEPALRGAGMCKFEQGKYLEAIHDLETAIALAPKIASSHLFLGVAFLALDRRQESRQELERALSIDAAGAVRAHVHLANLWMKENRPQEALAELETYLAAVPNAPDAEKLRAILSQLRSQSPKP